MRKLMVIPFLVVMAFAFSACDDDDAKCQSSGYCDDSGCYACEGEYCWPVDNEPCGPDGQVCDENQVCTDYGCANLCQYDEDCGRGEVCLPEGYCGPERPDQASCQTDEDCGHGMICEDNVCVEGCQSNDDCPEGYVCAACGRCEPEDNPVCGDSKVFCESDEDCGTKVCSKDHKCALTCSGSEECPIGQICEDGVCVDDVNPADPECVFSADCGDGYVCINAYCHPKCESDADCGNGEFCDLGVCKADYRPSN